MKSQGSRATGGQMSVVPMSPTCQCQNPTRSESLLASPTSSASDVDDDSEIELQMPECKAKRICRTPMCVPIAVLYLIAAAICLAISPIILVIGFVFMILFTAGYHLVHVIQGVKPIENENYKYPPVQEPTGEIRLLNIRPGSGEDDIVCELISGNLTHDSYEALSYCWGTSTFTKASIKLNGETFRVTPSVFQALRHLRSPTRLRTIWIDQISINQLDQEEKAAQVRQMNDIYSNASQVIVWLGDAPDSISTAFGNVETFHQTPTDEIESLWGPPSDWKSGFVELLQRPWWERVWIVQEVALGRNVVIQCDNLQISWDPLSRMITDPRMISLLGISFNLYKFVERVRYLQTSSTDPQYGLLSLAYDFRHRKASVSRDKLYALRGLLKTRKHALDEFTVTYKGKSREVWIDFAKASLKHYRNLAVVAILDGAGWTSGMEHGSSWVLDWNFFGSEEKRQPLWTGGLHDKLQNPLRGEYCAAGGARSRIRTDIVDPSVLLAQGFVHDTIVSLGPDIKISSQRATSYYVEKFAEWEKISLVAQRTDDSDFSAIFNATITAGNWNKEPMDWRFWNKDEIAAGHSGEDIKEYQSIRNAACGGRRLFLTSNNRMGICHKDAKIGDMIVVLLGSDVPFVMRPIKNRGSFWLRDLYFIFYDDIHQDCCLPVLHILVGQAYLHDIMHYAGDITYDIRTGRVKLQNFFIR